MQQPVVIRIKRPFAGLDFSYGGGEIVPVSPEIAAQWIEAGYAERIVQHTVETAMKPEPKETAAGRPQKTERKKS